MNTPTLAVVIATCDRGDAIVPTIESLLANSQAPDTIIVVDQSDGHRTRDALRPYQQRGACTLLHTQTKGLSHAHNLALVQVRTDVVALTDDDCVVASDWVEKIASTFEDPEVGVLFGNAEPAVHDSRNGLITGYVRTEPVLVRSLRGKSSIDGLGACMALRRSVWSEVGGFDEGLGAGTRFRAANDGDMAIRALRAGHAVAETPTVSVTHHGFRSWPEARELLCGYAFGTGAMLTKHLKMRTPSMVGLFMRLGGRFVAGRRHPPARLGGNRFALARLNAFARGCIAGLTTPVDRETLCFRPHEDMR